jgi:hypothetical protein
VDAKDREETSAMQLNQQVRHRISGTAVVEIDQVVELLGPIRPVDGACCPVEVLNRLLNLLDRFDRFSIDGEVRTAWPKFGLSNKAS